MEKFIVEISARHIHVTDEQVEILFGKDYKLTNKKDLSQPGQFACEEKLTIVGPKGEMKASILGPTRKAAQVELSLTDARTIGVEALIRESGDIEGTNGVKLVGPAGEITLDKGVIAAKRHIHMTPADAEKYGVKNGEIVKVRVESEQRSLVFDDTVVRVRDDFALAMHIDTDEGNAAGIKGSAMGEIIKCCKKENLKVIIAKDYEQASDAAFNEFKQYLKPGKVLGLATGSTPLGLYARMVKDHKENGTSYKEIKSFNLDEYVNLPISHPESYYAFMHRNLFNQIDIPEENTHVPCGLGDIEAQAKKYDEMIDNCPVDCQILGIGSDGHIAFNEPGTAFDSGTHVTDLAESTIKDNCRFFDNDISKVPTQAVTQGIGTIMKAKNIIIICTGANKADAVKAMLEGKVDEACPASILQRHNSVTVILDEAAASKLSK